MRPLEAAEILGVSLQDSEDKVKSKFRSLALKFHPDKCKDLGGEEATTRFQQINHAYQVVKTYHDKGFVSDDEFDEDADDDFFSHVSGMEDLYAFFQFMAFQEAFGQMNMGGRGYPMHGHFSNFSDGEEEDYEEEEDSDYYMDSDEIEEEDLDLAYEILMGRMAGMGGAPSRPVFGTDKFNRRKTPSRSAGAGREKLEVSDDEWEDYDSEEEDDGEYIYLGRDFYAGSSARGCGAPGCTCHLVPPPGSRGTAKKSQGKSTPATTRQEEPETLDAAAEARRQKNRKKKEKRKERQKQAKAAAAGEHGDVEPEVAPEPVQPPAAQPQPQRNVEPAPQESQKKNNKKKNKGKQPEEPKATASGYNTASSPGQKENKQGPPQQQQQSAKANQKQQQTQKSGKAAASAEPAPGPSRKAKNPRRA